MTTMCRRGDPLLGAVEDEGAAEPSAAVARRALAQWRWAVRALTGTGASTETRAALLGLVAWYERMSADAAYGNPAPVDGLEALATEERGPGRFLRRTEVAHWAVRVAQELAEFRRRGVGDEDPSAAFVAHAKLDLALRGAFDRLR